MLLPYNANFTSNLVTQMKRSGFTRLVVGVYAILSVSSTCLLLLCFQLAVEYESNAIIVKVDTDDEYEFARDMQVIIVCRSSLFITHVTIAL